MSGRGSPGVFDLYTINADVSGVKRLTTGGSGAIGSFSPGGRWPTAAPVATGA